MKIRVFLFIAFLAFSSIVKAQADPEIIQPILARPIQSPAVVTYQLQRFLETKVPPLPVPTSGAAWTAEAQSIREHLVNDVIFHGWPREWIDSPPHFEDLGRIPTAKGYTLHKLRYEIVPGFYSTALLYAPESLTGRVPAVLDVMGHFSAGNKEEFEQKLCIKQAMNGMIALNLEWINMGSWKRR